MDVYFTPMTCSLATRIALYEDAVDATFHEVALSTKKLPDGGDLLAINPRGQVPALRTQAGDVLTENAAVFQHLAALAGHESDDRLREWLSYVGSEIHKAIYYTIFDPRSPPKAKTFARKVLLPPCYTFLSQRFAERDYLEGTYTVADAHLFTTLCWAETAGVDLEAWPVLKAYRRWVGEGPAVARAVSEEGALRMADETAKA